MKLDEIDNKLLRLLQVNGRMSNVELAKQVDLSPPPCLRRIKNLEDVGIITGYKAIINFQKLGYAVSAVIVIHINSQSVESLQSICNRFRVLPSVVSCCSSIGNAEFIISVVAKTLDEYGDFLQCNLQSNSNIRSFEPYIIANTYKTGEFSVAHESKKL